MTYLKNAIPVPAFLALFIAGIQTVIAEDMPMQDSTATSNSTAMETTITETKAADTTTTDATTTDTTTSTGTDDSTAAVTAGTSSDKVPRAIFTSDVIDREPVNDMSTFSKNAGQIYFFTELRNLDGETVTHRWEHNGEVKAEVTINVGSPRWRAYSSKNILPEWTGEWTVFVTDSNNQVLQTSSFTVAE